jgi:hypothetical protein
MSSATCAEAIKSGENSMEKSYRSIEPKGIEDYLRELCVIYRGEMDNPHDVNSIIDEERRIQILRYHLWDVEKSVLENPGEWRYIIIEEYGSIPIEESAMARHYIISMILPSALTNISGYRHITAYTCLEVTGWRSLRIWRR